MRKGWLSWVVVSSVLSATAVAAPTDKEVFWKGFYRSPSGRVIVQFPESFGDGTVAEQNGIRAFTFKGSSTMTLVMVPPPLARDKQKQTFGELAKSFFTSAGPPAKIAPNTKPQVGEQKTEAGTVAMIRVDGTAGTLLAMWISDGDDAAGVFVAGATKEVERVASSIVDRMRVGSKVPVVADRGPGTRLSGIYSTRVRPKDAAWTTDWRVFDPRGYVSEVTPADPVALDIDALVLRASLGEPTWIYTYKIEGGKLAMTPLTKWGSAKTKSFEAGASLKIDGEAWFASKPGELPSVVGDWQAVQIATTTSYGGGTNVAKFEDRIVLRADGTAWYGNENGIVGNGRTGTGSIKWTFGGASSGEWKGKYTVDGNRIHVTTSDHRKFTMLVIAGRREDGTARPDVAFINGTGYRRAK